MTTDLDEARHRRPRAAVSVSEAAGVLRISRSHAYRLVRDGEIRAVRLGGRLAVPIRELDRLTECGATLAEPA